MATFTFPATGFVSGSPGTLPTGWTSAPRGTTQTISDPGIVSGIKCVDINFTGTPTSSPTITFSYPAFAALNSQVWTGSVYLALAAGSMSGLFNILHSSDLLNSVQGYLATVQYGGSITPTATLTQYSSNLTLNQVGVAFQGIYLLFNWNTGAINITLRIGLPTYSTPDFPAAFVATTTGASIARPARVILG